MGKVEKFEDLRCWQEARALTQEIYALCNDSPIRKDYRLRDQLTGATISIMANIAEGFARYHRGEFIRFLDIAQSSAVEAKSLLYVALDQGYASSDQVSDLQAQCERVKALTLGLLRYVKEKTSTTARDANAPYRSNAESEGQPSSAPPPFLELPDDLIQSS